MRRVAKKAIIVGYPAGAKAEAADIELEAYYRKIGRKTPEWLEEHVAQPMRRRIWSKLSGENVLP